MVMDTGHVRAHRELIARLAAERAPPSPLDIAAHDEADDPRAVQWMAYWDGSGGEPTTFSDM
jgi:hypothetical protein